jgi:hypothetical protein
MDTAALIEASVARSRESSREQSRGIEPIHRVAASRDPTTQAQSLYKIVDRVRSPAGGAGVGPPPGQANYKAAAAVSAPHNNSSGIAAPTAGNRPLTQEIFPLDTSESTL